MEITAILARRSYFRQTGCFPPQHLIILRRDVWERENWIARSLTDAFIRCSDQFAAARRSFPYVAAWLDIELGGDEALMEVDFHPCGFENNRRLSKSSDARCTTLASSVVWSPQRSILLNT